MKPIPFRFTTIVISSSSPRAFYPNKRISKWTRLDIEINIVNDWLTAL